MQHASSAKWHQAKYQDKIRTLKEDATNDASVLQFISASSFVARSSFKALGASSITIVARENLPSSVINRC